MKPGDAATANLVKNMTVGELGVLRRLFREPWSGTMKVFGAIIMCRLVSIHPCRS